MTKTTQTQSNNSQQGQSFDLIAHLQRQMEFSARTYGPGERTEGVCDHIRKELNEVQADAAAGVPTLSEWADVIILGFDRPCARFTDPDDMTLMRWRHGGEEPPLPDNADVIEWWSGS